MGAARKSVARASARRGGDKPTASGKRRPSGSDARGAAKENVKVNALDIEKVRQDLGRLWGLDRPISRAELARALDLSARFGGSHISKLERGLATLSGPIEVAVRMMLAGAVPHTMGDIIKPGYPRGPQR